MKPVALVLVLVLTATTVAAETTASRADNPGSPTDRKPESPPAGTAGSAVKYPSLDSLTERHQPYLHVNGPAESLLDCTQRVEALRTGLAVGR